MSLNIKESNGNKIYILSENRSFSEYLKDYKNNIKHVKQRSDYLKSFELIHDFQFNISSNRIKITKDLNNIMVSGIYAP